MFKQTKQVEFKEVKPLYDLTGKNIGNFKVKKLLGKGKNHIYWECECLRCSAIKTICSNDIHRNKSCGCYAIDRVTKHGAYKRDSVSKTIWHVYNGMMQRCVNKNASAYSRYGGRGITVCDRWSSSIENFINDMGERPFKNAQIDRIDNNGNYEPSNCRWVTPLENSNNNPRTIKIDGETVKQISERTGLSLGGVRYRLINKIPFDLPKKRFIHEKI